MKNDTNMYIIPILNKNIDFSKKKIIKRKVLIIKPTKAHFFPICIDSCIIKMY